MEQTAQGSVSPLLGFPPLTPFTLFFVLRDSFLGNLQVHKLEEQPTPRDETLRVLLVLAQMHDKTRLVGLEDKMEHRWDLLGCRWGIGSHVRGDADKGGEELFDDLWHHVVLLAESARKRN